MHTSRAANPGRPDLVVAEFEGHDYAGWTAAGTAFDPGPALGLLPRQLGIFNHVGDGAASSAVNGDGPRGTLTSPPFKLERTHISFLIGGGDFEYSTCFNLLMDGAIVRTATGRNSDTLRAESWDVSAYVGRTVQVQLVDAAGGRWGHVNLDHVLQTDDPRQPPIPVPPLYHETFRPQFHFSARQWAMRRLNPMARQEGWINDLNGLVYFDGEYHLFAQRWNKCWLHAVSRDLVHWTELPPAFWEPSLGSGCQSGTCVIDYRNTSGLAADPRTPPMVAFWSTNDNATQCMSYSLDHGRTWTHYPGNPVLRHGERDPKVFWYPPQNHWVMLLYGRGTYRIFTSTDLLHWADTGHAIPHSFECPDFFELPVDGDPANKRWVLIRGDGKYSTGTFDGTEFREQGPQIPGDIGPNFYASQTWANTDTGDGRRVQAAWVRSDAFPDMPFNQQVSFPCELSLHTVGGAVRQFRRPIRELDDLHLPPRRWRDVDLADGATLPLADAGDLFDVRAEVSIPAGATLVFNVRNEPVVLTSHSVTSGSAAGDTLTPVRTVQVLVDRASIETFVNDGEVSSTRCAFLRADGLSLRADGGAVKVRSLTVYPLRSAWPEKE